MLASAREALPSVKQLGERVVKSFYRMVHAAEIPIFGLRRRNLYRQIGRGPDFRNNQDQNSQQVRLEIRPFVCMSPVPLVVCASDAVGKNAVRPVGRMERKLMPMQYNLGFSERRE